MWEGGDSSVNNEGVKKRGPGQRSGGKRSAVGCGYQAAFQGIRKIVVSLEGNTAPLSSPAAPAAHLVYAAGIGVLYTRSHAPALFTYDMTCSSSCLCQRTACTQSAAQGLDESKWMRANG